MELRGKRAAVVGLGVSNAALIRYLVAQGVSVTACDKKTATELGERFAELSRLPVRFSLGPGYLDGLSGQDVIFLTPGMKKDLPQILAAREQGAILSSETNLFFQRCRAPIAGITGSAGKTTTTTMVGEIMRADGRRPVYVGGNIGNPLIGEAEDIPPQAAVVMELSSFQLEIADRSPHVALITNVSPNHLDIHASFEAYVDAKKNIYRFQGPDDHTVLNLDNEHTRAMSDETPARVTMFSRRGRPVPGAYLDGDELCWDDGRSGPVRICRRSELLIPGSHNVENALAAIAVSGRLGAAPAAMRGVLISFRGVPHRLELVAVEDGVSYYNDSIATSPDRTLAALETLDVPLVLIAGGYDKGIPFDELGQQMAGKVRVLLTIGKTAPKIEEAARRGLVENGGEMEIARCASLAEAVARARAVARPGEAVLLSPACASYDMFNNYVERGNAFKALVRGE